MEFIAKKTIDFSQDELTEMNNLFNDVFDRDRSLNEMINLYTKNPLGYSFHSIFIENEHIVGMNVYVPYFYKVANKKVLFANSIDSMIKKEHRDFFNFMDLVNTGYDYMKKEGVVFVYGYPNDNAYPIVTKSKLMKEIGQMYTYCLPYRIGGIKKYLKFLNWASELLCWTWLKISSIFASNEKLSYDIEKDLESFNITRYKLKDGDYKIQNDFVYKIINFEGIRAAFLIDVFNKTPQSFCKAVKHIMRKESEKFDILLYPGFISAWDIGMIKIPHRYEPKRFALCGKLLDNSFNSKLLWDINNWDTNLSNFDLI